MSQENHILKATTFYQWAYADLLGNANRGILAEYIVGRALDCDMTAPRREWDKHDLKTRDGTTIEVKTSGYVQSWPQKQPSKIIFNIGRTRGWDAATNVYDDSPSRCADVYVFCIHVEPDRERANPLDTRQWRFVVVSTDRLEQEIGEQRTVLLASLTRRLGATPVEYKGLPIAFNDATGSASGLR